MRRKKFLLITSYFENAIMAFDEIIEAHFYSKNSVGEVFVNSVNLKNHRKTGLLYRPFTSDSKMIHESFSDYSTLNCRGKVVMDCGGNIGGFMLKASQDGASHVVSFEPEPLNFEVLNYNARIISDRFANTKIEIKNYALCSCFEHELAFNVNTSKNSACSGSLLKTKSSTSIIVKACNFWEKLEEFRPQVLKIDIEGAEYSLFTREFPSFIEDFAFELHGFKKELRQEMFKYIEMIEKDPRFEVVSKRIIHVFNVPKLALLHFRRR